jgi:hypothetical protein
MIFIRDFTNPVSLIFNGNLLLLVSCFFYIAWWVTSFRPDSPSGGIFIAAAIIAGGAAIVFMSGGVNTLSQAGKGFPVRYILIGSAVLFIALLALTAIVLHRTVTSELLLIIVWAALEFSALAVLHGSGILGLIPALTLTSLALLAIASGIVCYILYYRLDVNTRFIIGLIPLIADAAVIAVFLATLAVSIKNTAL